MMNCFRGNSRGKQTEEGGGGGEERAHKKKYCISRESRDRHSGVHLSGSTDLCKLNYVSRV